LALVCGAIFAQFFQCEIGLRSQNRRAAYAIVRWLVMKLSFEQLQNCLFPNGIENYSFEDFEKHRSAENEDIKIRFEDFKDGNYSGEERNLYILWRDDVCLYVGISRNNVWNRWFGNLSPHYSYYGSQVGRCVLRNQPESMEWEIELRYIGFLNDLEETESELIFQLDPLFNVIYNTKKLSEKKQKLKNLLLYGKEKHISNEGVILE
jgi:hypothetical protein